MAVRSFAELAAKVNVFLNSSSRKGIITHSLHSFSAFLYNGITAQLIYITSKT